MVELIFFKMVFHMVFNRSHAGEFRELCMNVDKVVFTDPVRECDHGIRTVESLYINLCR